MFHIAVCDDEKYICEEIRSFSKRFAEERSCSVDFFMCFSGEELFDTLEKEVYFDIIFLDIELYCINGVEIGKWIREDLKDSLTQIVYISSKQDYAMDLFSVHPLDFLLKPLYYEKIALCLDQMSEIKIKRGDLFEYDIQGEHHRVPLSNILYFESFNRKICITRVCGKEEFYGKLGEVESKVEDKGFLKIHKSYIINPLYVNIYGKTTVTMTNGDVLPVSRERQKELSQLILERKFGDF